jgi:hypothetical protein
MKKHQKAPVVGNGHQISPDLAEQAAWWMLTGVTDPGYGTRFAYECHEEQRAFIEAQINRIIVTAEMNGVGGTLGYILASVFHQPPLRWRTFYDIE